MLARLVRTVVPAALVKQAVKATTVLLVQLVPKEIPVPWVVPVRMAVPAREAHLAVTVQLVIVVFVLNIALLMAVFSWMEAKENFDW